MTARSGSTRRLGTRRRAGTSPACLASSGASGSSSYLARRPADSDLTCSVLGQLSWGDRPPIRVLLCLRCATKPGREKPVHALIAPAEGPPPNPGHFSCVLLPRRAETCEDGRFRQPGSRCACSPVLPLLPALAARWPCMPCTGLAAVGPGAFQQRHGSGCPCARRHGLCTLAGLAVHHSAQAPVQRGLRLHAAHGAAAGAVRRQAVASRAVRARPASLRAAERLGC